MTTISASEEASGTTPRSRPPQLDVPHGLAGVVVAETSIGDVLGAEGRYHYRGRDAIELASTGRFEDVWRLLMLGGVQDADAADADDTDAGDTDAGHTDADAVAAARFRDRVAPLRVLPQDVAEFITAVVDAGDGQGRAIDPLRGLQATLPVLAAARGARPLYDLSDDERIDEALAVAAATPGILAAFHRSRLGIRPIVAPDDRERGAVANYLVQVTGSRPDDRAVHALSAYLIATLDHGFNASTFAARVIASTGADMASCIAGGLGALSGPLHGGAPSRALDALDSVPSDGPAGIERFIRTELTAGRRLMGFGHAVYRTLDPRARLLKQVALEFGGPRVALAVEYEETAERLLKEHRPGRDLHANVEFYAAVVLEQCGIPRDMFTPTFAMARIIGWSAHVLEQARDPKIIRPSSRYVPRS